MHPWASIWTSPRSTIRQIVAENPNRALWGLAFIYGFSSLLNTAQSLFLGIQFPALILLALACIVGPIWGYICFNVWSFVILFTGKWFKGVAPFASIRAAYGWSCTPLLVNIPLWLILIYLFGTQLFTNFSTEPSQQKELSIFLLVLLVRMVAAIWSLVLYINTLAEVQQFSVLKSIGNIFISGLIITAVFYLCLFLFDGLFSGAVDQTKSVFHLFYEGTTVETLRHL